MQVHIVIRERIAAHYKGVNRQYEVLLATRSKERADKFKDELARSLPGWDVYVVSRELEK